MRLIQKWLAAGVLEDGVWSNADEGTPQGATISPLLANIYLHYVFDLWVQQWRSRKARGDVIVVRYADDLALGFQHEVDVARFRADLRQRFERFGLELHADKTRHLRFGPFAEERRRERGQGRPEVFECLGFTHICGRTKAGKFLLYRHTSKSRMRAKLKVIVRSCGGGAICRCLCKASGLAPWSVGTSRITRSRRTRAGSVASASRLPVPGFMRFGAGASGAV